MPLSICEVVNNGHWKLGKTFCQVQAIVEALTEVISIFHTICMCLDSFLMVRKPFMYRSLTSRTGYGMVAFSWTIPSMTFAFAISLGWHTEGMEETLRCLDQYYICIPIFNKKLVLFIIPLTVATSFVVLLLVVVVLLKTIHKFHQRQLKQNELSLSATIPTNKSSTKNSKNARDALKSRQICTTALETVESLDGNTEHGFKDQNFINSLCNNVSIDLSESSLKLTSNKHLLVAIVALASVIAAFTVRTDAVIFLTLIYTRRKRTTARSCGVSSNAKLLMASLALVHVIIGGFCMPTAIMQIVAKGE
ncbi:hypothetical protein Btru_037186 [Bulinus truncatus]|nr:hypothetical protein Btru_037186 [Bulinus truncatus]